MSVRVRPRALFRFSVVMKGCRRCGKEKELEAFASNSRSSDGHHSWCRACVKQYDADRFQSMPRDRSARLARAKVDRKARQRWLQSLKDGRACGRCGESHVACLDWHHRDPGQKRFTIGNMNRVLKSKATVLAEIAKCDLLCSNCHRKEHWDKKDKRDVA